MQVKLEWLEAEPKSRKSSRGMPAVDAKKRPPPLPREEPDEPAAEKKKPPPLPPEETAKRPSRAGMKAVRRGPPPLPREDPPEPPKRPSKRP